MKKEMQMFEPQASFCTSHFVTCIIGNPKGSEVRSPSFAYIFLAKQEK